MNRIKNSFWMMAAMCLVLTGQVWAGEKIELLGSSNIPVLLMSDTAPSCLKIAAKDFQQDFFEATGQKLKITNKIPKGKTIILAGVAGRCDFLKALDATYKLGFEKLPGKWETFVIEPLEKKNILVVAGSDPRGAAYGLYELSERLLGTDPLKFWTGHVPGRKSELVWQDGTIKEGPPTFQYRGFFINDEDSLLCWKNVDRNVEPEVYAKILETICRLKGNMVAPAMYANYMTDETRQLVNDRGLFYTASHLEILLTNPSVGYWDKFTKANYGKALPYSFVRHPAEMEAFWRDSVRRHGEYLNVWPIGLRGFDDRDFSETDDAAPKTVEERAALTGKTIMVQRKVLKEELPKDAHPITTLTMRGEVYEQYKTGKMNLPEDALLIWQDSGSTATMPYLPEGSERTRKGGNGIYYHLSYCDNQWTQWVPLQVLQDEFRKSIDAGITRYALFNVGDMREIPQTMAASMDLVWNASPWRNDPGHWRVFLEQWCAYQFGQDHAKEIADIYEAYWKLEYPSRVTSVVEVVAPNITSDLIASFWKQESLTKLAKKTRDPDAFAEYAAETSFNANSPRLGKVSPEYLGAAKPQWDALYGRAMAIFQKIPKKDQQFFFDNIILQLQTSRLVNHWSVDVIEAFQACAGKRFDEAASLFDKATAPLLQLIDAREQASRGKWKNWFRGEEHNGWQNSLWALKPAGLLRDTKALVGTMEDAAEASWVVLAVKNSKPASMDFPNDPEIKKVARELGDFFKERNYSISASSGTQTESFSRLTLTTVEHLKESSLPEALAQDISGFLDASRNEAYALYVGNDAEHPEVFLVGKTIPGLRAAAERFRAKVSNDGSSLKIKLGLEKNSPFIKGRLMNIGDSPRRQTPDGSPFKDADPEVWPAQKLFSYPELYRQLGFNGVQLGECRGYGSISGKVLELARNAAITLAKGAKKSGMTVSWFVWGDALFDEFEVLCWNDPEERKTIEDFHREQADLYGEYVDHVNVHISDPGGCTRNGCDAYKTRQQLAAYIIGEFRRINPGVEGALSTWANGAFWLHAPAAVGLENYFSVFLPPPGQIKFAKPIPDGAKFLDDTFMPKDIGIALNRFYQADQAKYVVESGRPLDIWGWYISDHEMRNNMAFNMKNIDAYFRALPPEAGEQIRYYSAEINFHGWPQIINAYVVAQKMWDPGRSLDEIEMEFCTATFGPQNASAMAALYNAVEAGYDGMIPQPPDFGTADYNQHLREVLKKAQAVRLDNDWKPNFDFPVPATKYVDMLVARLRLVLAVSEAKEQVDEARGPNPAGAFNTAKSLVFQGVDANGSQVVSAAFFPHALKLQPGHSIGQTFSVVRDFSKIGVQVGTWGATNAGLTLSLYDKLGGTLEATADFSEVPDNKWIWLESKSRFPSGRHYLELSNPTGDAVGVYAGPDKVQPDSIVYFDRQPVGREDEAIRKIKRQAIENLPHLPIDPIYNQDETIVLPTYKTRTFAERIEQL